MPAEDLTDHTPTLGQRIDALLGPLDAEAQAFREAITGGRAQLAQMQARIDQAEQALAGIEGKMIRVLQSLAAEEPMLALAMGAGDELPPDLPPAPMAQAQTPSVSPAASAIAALAPPAASALPDPATVTQTSSDSTPESTPAQILDDTPEVVSLEIDTPLDVGEVIIEMPTLEEDAAAVDAILDLLDADPGLAGCETSKPLAGDLADAAAQADEVARALDGAGE